MANFLEGLNRCVWGVPALFLILTVGILLSVKTKWVQLRMFPLACRTFFREMCRQNADKETTSAYQSLCTALAATVGTGNLAGVAGALCIGGPGAIFWMWCCGILGMVIKFAEAVLAVRYRVRDETGGFTGGPMYMIRNGLGESWAWMGSLYCFFGVAAAFGVGNATQVNAVIGGINRVITDFGGKETNAGNLIMGILLGIAVVVLLLGGAKRIGAVAQRLVPLAAGIYLLLGIGVLLLRAKWIPDAFTAIVRGAFQPRSVTGGVLGSVMQTLRIGVSRGVFTNEAGMGTAAIAHGASDVRHPVEQGLMGIMEVFLDTIVICTMTALVILCSGVKIPYGTDVGIALTAEAFSTVCGNWTSVAIAGALCCFAFATILGWGLYGARCAQYLFGPGAWRYFAVIQGIIVILGAMLKTGTVWILAEIFNGLMAIPNLITLAALSSELIRLTKDYTFFNGRKPADGGTHESIHQCKPL